MTTPLDAEALALQAAVAGQWSLERELGRGGMGIVYLARDVALDRPVAIKLLHPTLAADPAECARFLHEARTGARLAHPHIVPIYEVGDREGLVWFVMGHVDGETVGARVRREGPLPPADVERIVREVGWALGAAHAHGILHRDVTLENILLERRTGRALLVDFGIAATLEGGVHGTLAGTAEYIAPELLEGAAPSPASDLYALGVAAWAMLTGRLPFTGPTTADTLLAHLQQAAPPVAEVAPGTPRHLARAVDRALAPTPALRGDSAESWVQALDPAHRPAPIPTPLQRWVAHGPTMRPFYALAASLTGMAYFTGIAGNMVAMGLITFVIAAGIHALSAARTVVGVARAGYGIGDLRVALAATMREREARGTVPAPLLGRVVRDLTWLAAACLLTVMLYDVAGLWRYVSWQDNFYALMVVLWEVQRGLILALWSGIAFRMIVPASPERPRSLAWRWRMALWQSSLGRHWFALLAPRRARQEAPTVTLHRPTEMMLGIGIRELHAALPAVTRAATADVPIAAERLEQRVADLRTRLAAIDAAPQTPASQEAADSLRARRDEAIRVLERLRRELARLGQSVAPTGPLTACLEEASAVEAAVLEALGAGPGVRRLLSRPAAAGSPHPTPTPAA